MANLAPTAAAKLLGISRTRMVELLNAGRVPGAQKVKVGNRFYWEVPTDGLTEIEIKEVGRPRK